MDNIQYWEKSMLKFQDKLNMVVYRYLNNTYVKDTEMELKLTDYEKLLNKRIYLLSYIEVFFNWWIVLDETTVQK